MVKFLTTSIIQRIMRHQSFALFQFDLTRIHSICQEKNKYKSGYKNLKIVLQLLTILLKETITDKMLLTQKKNFWLCF